MDNGSTICNKFSKLQIPRHTMEVIPVYGDEMPNRAGLPKCGLTDLFPVANN